MRSFVVAGTHSGVGKTTLTLALIAALRGRGLRVRAFKIGPDFIDAAHLAAATGADCLNLDGWMLGREACRLRLARAAVDCDVAVVEGMMGLYDGLDGTSETGSSAEMAKWLELPVVLVADASGGARSLAATILGFQQFDPGVRLAAVIFNRVGGPGHITYLRQGMAAVPGVEVLGGCSVEARLHIPERHLGLSLNATVQPDGAWVESHLDLEALLATAAEIAPDACDIQQEPPPPGRRRMGIARDDAFCFYYPDNLALLRNQGIELVPFSPLRESVLPAKLTGIYLGGGYPELHAAALHANTGMREEVRRFAADGGFIYAECGGMMYLAQSLDGVAMAGVLPAAVAMQPRLAAIGYRAVVLPGLAGGPELKARGHEFHYSRLETLVPAHAPALWTMQPDGSRRPEGFHCGNVFASYIHLHFGSCPELPAWIKSRMAAGVS